MAGAVVTPDSNREPAGHALASDSVSIDHDARRYPAMVEAYAELRGAP